MFKITRGYVLSATKTKAESSVDTPYPVYSSQTKDNGLMGYYSDYLYDTAITWTTDGANAGTVRFRPKKFYCTNVCGVLLSENGYANQMVAEALNLIAWKYVSKVGNPKLMNNVMAEVEVYLPINKVEQAKASALFTSIDNLITLHQCLLINEIITLSNPISPLIIVSLPYLAHPLPESKYLTRKTDNLEKTIKNNQKQTKSLKYRVSHPYSYNRVFYRTLQGNRVKY